MEISASVSTSTKSIYTQYQNLADRVKGGELNSKETIEQYRAVSKKAQGYGIINLNINFKDTPPIHATREVMNIFAEPEKNKHLIHQIYAEARVAYDAAKLEKGSSGQATGPILGIRDERPHKSDTQTLVISKQARYAEYSLGLGPQNMQEIRNSFNAESATHLRDYASKHKGQWASAASSLGISIGGWTYGRTFNQQPDDASLDITVGVPNSNAEKIFRYMASAADIETFNAKMAPAQLELETAVQNKMLVLIEQSVTQFDEFTSSEVVLKSAGITHNDLTNENIVRNMDGRYTSVYESERGDAVASIINENPDVRAIYDAKWDSFPNSKFLKLYQIASSHAL